MFQYFLDELSITNEFTPPDIPQSRDQAEKGLGVLKEKAIALME